MFFSANPGLWRMYIGTFSGSMYAITVGRSVVMNAPAHGYFTVDHRIVWQTVQQNLPDLKQRISAL